VLFIDGSSVQALESGIVAKVKSLGSAYSRTTAEEALDVLAHPDHEITRDWAIVYDNVDNPAIKIPTYFPKCLFGTVFITTRNPNLGNLATNAHLRLDIMSEDEAVEVLLRSAVPPPRMATEGERHHARRIAKDLGYLPVALVQAGYFIRLHNCMDDYSRRLQTLRPSLLDRPAEFQVDNHYHGVYATLEVTWPYLSPRAQNFMSILGFVNYTGFPLILISRAARYGFLFEPHVLVDRPDAFHQTVQLLRRTFIPREEPDQQDVDDLVAELEGYSLITRMSTFMVKALRLHPLVHSWVHDRLSAPEKEVYRSAATRLLVCGTGNSDEDIFEFIHPHITSWSDRLGLLHLNDLAGFARVFIHQGGHLEGVALWERICKDVSELYGADDVRTSEAKLQLAGSYWTSRSNPAIATEMEREVVELRMRTLGPTDPRTVKALAQQARGMARNWDTRDESVSILRHVIELCQAGELVSDWESLLEAKEWLASVLFGTPDPLTASEVIRLSIEVLQDRVERNGRNHHATLKATETLAAAYSEYAGYPWWEDINTTGDSAVNLWNFVVKARTERRGVHHPDTLDAMERLAWSYYPQGEYETFVTRWGEVFSLRRDVQGSTHEKTTSMMARLHRTRSSRWDGTEAQAAIQKGVIFAMREIHGPAHEDTIESINNLAAIYERWGRCNEAVAYREEALVLRKQLHGVDHDKTRDSWESLARTYGMCGRYGDAITLWKNFIARTSELHGCAGEATIGAKEAFSVLCEHWKQYEEAIVQRKEVLALREEKMGIHHKDTNKCMESLAQTYGMCGQSDAGRTQWKDFIARIRELNGCAGEVIIDAMEAFAIYCERWKQYEEAIVQRKDVLALREENQGTHHAGTIGCIGSLVWTYKMCGQSDVALAQWEDLIAQSQELHGCAHADTVKAML
jgi:tetratricopeptide (TPR) repeat protein